MAAHVIDMVLLQNSFSTEEMRAIWDERNRLQKQLDVEGALALAEGELAVIPAAAAKKIAGVADNKLFDLEELATLGLTAKHSLMPTIQVLQRLAGDAGEYVHYGVTTQDVVDTATVLQLQQAHTVFKRDLRKLLALIAAQAKRYQKTPLAGHTHGMQALPTTFGFKLAVLLCELGRHLERFEESEKRVFVGVLAGAVGTYASLGEAGPQVEKAALEKLGLGVPEICWHSSRDRMSEYASLLALVSATLGKIGNEFYNLMRSEINELEEPFSAGKIGSSTMPHKRNPAAFEGLASLTRPVFAGAALIRESMLVEHERDAMSWRAEWIALPEICLYTANQLSVALSIFAGLQVKEENMLTNLLSSGGLIVSERVMFALGEFVGKQTAHHIVYELAMQSEETKQPFAELLQQDQRVREHFSEKELATLLDPRNYLGQAVQKVDEVLALAQKKNWIEAKE